MYKKNPFVKISFFKNFLRKKSTKQSKNPKKILSKSEKYQKIINSFRRSSVDEMKSKKKKIKKDKFLFFRNLYQSQKYEKLILSFKRFKSDLIVKNSETFFKNSSQKIKFFDLFKNKKFLKNKLKNKKNVKKDKFKQKIGIIFYSDHCLILSSLNIDLDNNIEYIGLTESTALAIFSLVCSSSTISIYFGATNVEGASSPILIFIT